MHYNATVEMDLGPKLAEGAMATMLGRLVGYSAAIARSQWGKLEVTLTVPADSLAQAAATAIAVAENGTKMNALGIEVIPTEVFDRRLDLPSMPELVSVTEAAELLGVTRQRVLQLVGASKLPSAKVGETIVIPRTAIEQRLAGEI